MLAASAQSKKCPITMPWKKVIPYPGRKSNPKLSGILFESNSTPMSILAPVLPAKPEPLRLWWIPRETPPPIKAFILPQSAVYIVFWYERLGLV